MDPAEIIKAAPEIAKVVGPVAAAVPFTGIVKKMLGPAADELAKMWEDQIRLYRYERQMKCVEKAAKMAKDAGFTPKAVPPKILFPLLEGASMEEDDNLHDMWAALLANASSDTGHIVRPSFLALLRELAPDEAVLLVAIAELPAEFTGALKESGFSESDSVGLQIVTPVAQEKYKELESILFRTIRGSRSRFPRLVGEDDSAEHSRFEVCAQTLESVGLIDGSHLIPRLDGYRLTARGKAFLEACRPPEPKR